MWALLCCRGGCGAHFGGSRWLWGVIPSGERCPYCHHDVHQYFQSGPKGFHWEATVPQSSPKGFHSEAMGPLRGTTATQHKHQEQIQTPLAEANSSSNTNVTSSSQHHLQNQHHQQKQVSPAIVIIANTTIRTRHDKQHRQCRPKLAEQAVPADASISSRASVTSRNLCRTSIKTQSSHH